MTRDEAIQLCQAVFKTGPNSHNIPEYVDSLTALGILKLDATDEVLEAAGRKLAGRLVTTRVTNPDPSSPHYTLEQVAALTIGGAYEVLDILRKSGFKITKE